MKTMRLFAFTILASALTIGFMSCSSNKNLSESTKNSNELLIGTWHQTNSDKVIKNEVFYTFNGDKSFQITSTSAIEGDIIPPVYGTWESNGNIIKTVTLSNKEKNKTEWRILKLDKESLELEYYDASHTRFEYSFKRINK